MNNDCLIIVPVYNEEKHLNDTLRKLKKFFKNILIVNDGSSDNTLNLLNIENITVLNHLVNIGQGGALESGMLYFINKTNFKYLITFDADGQHIAEVANLMLKELKKEKAFACIGSRFKNSKCKIPKFKRITLMMASIYEKLFFSIDLSDAHNGLRVFKRELVEKYILPLKNHDMCHATEISFKVCNSKKYIIEYPVNIIYNNQTQSPLNAINIVLRFLFNI